MLPHDNGGAQPGPHDSPAPYSHKVIPFSQQYPNLFLSRHVENLDVLLSTLSNYLQGPRADIGDGEVTRRAPQGRFQYAERLSQLSLNQTGLPQALVIEELNDMAS